jgi:hypothetical protein
VNGFHAELDLQPSLANWQLEREGATLGMQSFVTRPISRPPDFIDDGVVGVVCWLSMSDRRSYRE